MALRDRENEHFDFKDILRQYGFKVTPARLEILKILSSAKKPLSASDVSEKVRRHRINYVTIYRSLGSFEENSIVRRVPLKRGSTYYEIARKHQHRIICTQCGRTETIEGEPVKGIEKFVAERSRHFPKITGHSLQIYGVCSSCVNRL